jgi:hypothetical protein
MFRRRPEEDRSKDALGEPRICQAQYAPPQRGSVTPSRWRDVSGSVPDTVVEWSQTEWVTLGGPDASLAKTRPGLTGRDIGGQPRPAYRELGSGPSPASPPRRPKELVKLPSLFAAPKLWSRQAIPRS